MTTLIRQVYHPGRKKEVDLLMEHGVISAIGDTLSSPGAETIDGRGYTLMPALIDIHAHTDKAIFGHPWFRNEMGPNRIDRITYEREHRIPMGLDPYEIADVVGAVGNHDEDAGIPVSPVAAALILADKTDVRRSRVRNKDITKFDIHDRVNYAVEQSHLVVNETERTVSLVMSIDDKICSVMDYFEIFLTRMIMSRRAAEFLDVTFELYANGVKLI